MLSAMGVSPALASESSKAKAIYLDSSICTGCRVCELACSKWNRLPLRESQVRGHYQDRRGLSAFRWLSMCETSAEARSDADRVFARYACMHCSEAACMMVCPAGAISRTSYGAVVINSVRCIGCGYCIANCPYQVIGFDQRNSVARRCTYCSDRVDRNEVPACVHACPPGALDFGDRHAMAERARRRVSELRSGAYAKADVYGLDELGGLGVIQVLPLGKESLAAVSGLPANPRIPDRVQVWDALFPPVRVLVAAGLVAGLILNWRWSGQLNKPQEHERQQ